MLLRKSDCFAIPTLIALILSAFISLPAYADIGPKPSLEFRVKYSIPVVEVTSGQLMQSDKPDCSNAEPLKELGPQGLHFDGPRWNALAYGFKEYSKLEIQFADKKRTSNVFDTKAFSGYYQVDVRDNDLVVTAEPLLAALAQGGARYQLIRFSIAAGITLFIEMILGAIYMAIARKPVRLLAWILLANLMTLTIVWFVFPNLPLNMPWMAEYIAYETFAWLAEAWFLHRMMRGEMRWWTALILSLVLNGVSGFFTVLT